VPGFFPSTTQEELRLQTGEATVPISTGLSESTPNPKQDLYKDPNHYQSLIGLGQGARLGLVPKQHSPLPNKAYYSSAGTKRGQQGGVGNANAFMNPSSRMTTSSQRLPSDPTKKTRSRSNAQLQQSVGKKVNVQMPIHLLAGGGAGAASSYKQRFEDLYRKSREQRSPPGPSVGVLKMSTLPTAKFSSEPNVGVEESLLGKPIRKVSETQSEVPAAKLSTVSRSSGAGASSVAQLMTKMGVTQSKKDKYTPTVFAPLFPN
jgi:hypothetical protein